MTENAIGPWGALFLRGIAALIDIIIFTIQALLITGLSYIMYLIVAIAGANSDSGPLLVIIVAVASIILSLSAMYFYFLYPIGKHGCTRGMKGMGLTLTRIDGGKVGYILALLRYLCILIFYSIPVIGWVMILISIITILCSERQQAIHDMVCKTVVRA
jgi:uncharacterized RDD family membrane protein YckC